MDKSDIQKLRDLPIEGVAERLGLHVERHKSLCPFHEDKHPSLSFNVRQNTCRCFACMTQSMGTIDLVMKHLNKDFRDACRWLASDEVQEVQRVQKVQEEPKPFDAGRYERFFERPYLSEEARKFLFVERRLDERVVRWCRLTSWRDKHGIPWLQIPYYDREGKLVGVQNRNLTPLSSPKGDKIASPWGGWEGVPRFRFPQGSECGIYNLPVLNLLEPGEALWITEGCSDCWAMLSSGRKAIAIPSATLLTKKDIEQLSIINSQLSISFHMFPDRDTPGERLFLQLQKVLPNLEHHQLPPDCKDFGEMFIKLRIDN